MKLLALPRLAALDALRAQPVFFLLPVISVVASLAFAKPDSIWFLVALMAAVALAAGLLTFQPGKLLFIYFAYLMFEGMFKLVTNYNVVARFGSDILLGVVFVRLLARYQSEGNPDLTDDTKARFRKLVGFFTVFWLWVGIQFVNPSGLGLIPSLAGLKIYLLPLVVFFSVVLLARDHELKQLPKVMLLLGIFQACVAVVDWYQGPMGIPSLHPRYAVVIKDFLKGFPYRPFGTTNLPGGPSLWMFHCLFGGLLCLSNARHEKGKAAALWQSTFSLFVVLAVFALIACQIRLSLMRFLALLAAGLLTLGKTQAVVGTLVVGGLLAFFFSSVDMKYEDALQKKSLAKFEDRFQLAVTRLASLQDKETWAEARGGNWAVTEFFRRASITVFGIGLSRMGAASAPWTDRIAEDRYFDRQWSFSDNLVLALFTEIGLGGMLGYLVLILALLVLIGSLGSKNSQICLATCAIIFFSGWGSEGILFQPDASLFWLAAGYGLRSPKKEVIGI